MRKRAEDALRQIVLGTASDIGAEFFPSLVKSLASALEVRYAFIAEMVDPEGEQLRIISFWTGDTFGDTFTYASKSTPCDQVVGKKLAYFPAGVQELFPDDLRLKEFGVESYLAIPLFASNGSALGHLGVMHDVEMNEDLPGESVLRIFAARASAELERAQMDEALRESERMLRLVVDNIDEVFWIVDPKDYSVLYVSLAYEELWGRTCQSAYEDPQSWLAAVHPGDLERVTAAFEKQRDTGEFDEEFRIVRPDGSIRWVWDHGIAVRDEHEQLQLMVGIVANITARKRAEEALQEVRDQLESKVEESLERENLYGLSFRELTVLYQVARGKADKEIAGVLGII